MLKRNCLFFLLIFILTSPSQAITGDVNFGRFHPAIAKHGMVSSPSNYATEVGVRILQEGGNAIDAAVATAFTLSVTRQESGGLGGGGFMMIYLAKDKKVFAINYREIAPLAATAPMYLDKNQQVDRNKITLSHLAAGVPGTVAGLIYVQKNYGTLTLQKVLQPAIKLAEQGFPVSYEFSQLLLEKQQQINKYSASKKIYMPNGKLLEVGDLLIQNDLANTLRLIAKDGEKPFYTGEIAKKISSDMQKNGGLITEQDLSSYKIEIVEPLKTNYKGYQVVTMPLPSAGGIALIQLFDILHNYPLALWGLNSAQSIHTIAEVLNLVFAERARYLGDSNFVAVPVVSIINPKRLEKFTLNLEKHIPANQLQTPAMLFKESPDTAHFAVIDKDRNVVSNTFTLNDILGSGIIIEGTGILLNNEMDDFTSKVGVANAFGIVSGKVNDIQPKKRPISSMTPTIIFDAKGNPVMAIGASGGSRIISVILQVILNVFDYQLDIASAISSPRFHSQWLPDEIVIEQGFSPDTIDKLKHYGHTIQTQAGPGAVQGILIKDDMLYGAADPRIPNSLAMGY